MTVTTDVSIKNARLEAIRTTWSTTSKLRLYSGTMPASASASLSGNTQIVEVTPAPAAASAGTMDMLGGAKSAAASAGPLTATFYRVYNSGGSTCYEQGTVGTSASDLIIDNTSINSGQTVNFATFTKTEP